MNKMILILLCLFVGSITADQPVQRGTLPSGIKCTDLEGIEWDFDELLGKGKYMLVHTLSET